MTKRERDLHRVQDQIVACELCPRLRQHCINIGVVKRRAYRQEIYWSRPVPSFGDPQARVLLLGLAPGAHGANRTGRMFTGDSSGDFLYRAMWKTGFASQPTARRADDGLELRDAYISASAHCAPPDNKPTPLEIAACRPFLEQELQLLPGIRVVIALGRIAFDNYLELLRASGRITRKSDYTFAHGHVTEIVDGLPYLLASYHPSQQNTSTGKLTEKMLVDVFRRAAKRARR